MILSDIATNTRVSYTVEMINIKEKSSVKPSRLQYRVPVITGENADAKEVNVASQRRVKKPIMFL